MKFGFYSPYLNTFGGGERYMLTLASHLSKNHVVDIFWDDKNIKPLLAKFLKIDLTQTHFANNIFNEGFLKKSFKTLGYNLIFVLSDGSVPYTLAVKNILHFQVPFNTKSDNFKNKLKLKKYKYVVANSIFTKGYIDKSYGVNSIVIYPPVDTASIKAEQKEKLILSVGRFGSHNLHNKKQEVLVEVFKELSKKAPGWKLILIGQAKKEDEKYLRRIKKSTRGYPIRVLENLQVDKLREFYSKASIYWHAAGFGENELKNPEKMEHFGIATVEASAAGAVPVVIDAGGQKEIVEDNKNGRLWSTKANLLEYTLDLINNPPKLQKLSAQAIKNSTRFSVESFIAQYEKIIF